MAKTGRISKEEEAYLASAVETATLSEMAKHLDRDEKTIQNTLKRMFVSSNSETINSAKILKSKPYWPALENQFNQEELELFVNHWTNIVSQFKNDTFYTEELQIVEVCKLELLINRTLTDQQNTRLLIDATKQRLEKPGVKGDEKAELETKLVSLYISLTQSSKDYKDLLSEIKHMLKEIKGSREQRIKQLESSRESFGGWFRVLMLDPIERKRIGLDMEKNRLATQQEVVRLSELHQYENGEYDRPLLNADSIGPKDNIDERE